MTKIKEMPSSEKYALVIDQMKPEELIAPFIRKHLGDQALIELEKIWQEGIKPVPESTSDDEKYEVAYSNFIWWAKSNMNFIRSRLGEDGIEQYKLTEIAVLERKNAGLAMSVLGLIRAVSPGLAFTLTAKQMGYQFQWITPYSLRELTKDIAIFDIPRCKVLDFPDSEYICQIGCQGVFPEWFARQFKVSMKFEPVGNSCTCIVKRL